MTQSGEQVTVKGEYHHEMDGVFSFNKTLNMSYGEDIGNRGKIALRMSCTDPERLDVIQMIFVLKGEVCFSGTDGQHSIFIAAQQHNIVRVPLKSTKIMLSSVKDDFVGINLKPEFLNKYLPEHHPARTNLLTAEALNQPCLLTALNMAISPEINAILQRLGNSTQSNLFDQLMLESKVIELLALQLSQAEQYQDNLSANRLKKEERERMHKAREILIHHQGEPLSLKSLAHLVGTNEFNLKRDFKLMFGNTVYGYLNQHKMEKAKSLLIENEITIAEISEKIGYKYPTHFTSAFKKYFGYLPNKIKSYKLAAIIFIEEIISLSEYMDYLFI